jgi:hypothetical protein
MKKLPLFVCMLVALSPVARAQLGAQAREFDIKTVTVAFIDTPDYQVSGTPKKAYKPAKWMEVEVDFDAKPDFTDELVLNYYIAVSAHPAARLLVGSVTHVNIQKGADLHSVMYVSPKTMSRILGGHPVTNASIANVAVTISKPGVQMPVAEKSFKPMQANWWATMKQETGFVMNKSETPFAPLFWDRYEAIKSPAAK